MKFDNEKIKKITEELYKVVQGFDPGCEITTSIESALHTDSCEVVSKRLKIILDFTPMEGELVC